MAVKGDLASILRMQHALCFGNSPSAKPVGITGPRRGYFQEESLPMNSAEAPCLGRLLTGEIAKGHEGRLSGDRWTRDFSSSLTLRNLSFYICK